MPTYEYVCDACGHEVEYFQSITAAPKRKCPACEARKLRRRISAGAGILFRGSGFYTTDYRSDSYRAGQKADSDASTGGSSKGDAPKSDSKPTPPASD